MQKKLKKDGFIFKDIKPFDPKFTFPIDLIFELLKPEYELVGCKFAIAIKKTIKKVTVFHRFTKNLYIYIYTYIHI